MNLFALILGFGCTFGLGILALQPSGKKLLPVGLLLLGLALIGARAGFVFIRWPYYSQHILEVFSFSKGGLDGAGALFGGWAGLILVTVSNKQAIAITINDMSRFFIPVVMAAWLGCWLEGAAYGPSLPYNWMAWLDWHSPFSPHWPLPFFAALFLLIYFFSLDRCLLHSKKKQVLSFLYIIGILISLYFVSIFRQDDPAPFWDGVRIDEIEILSLIFIILITWLRTVSKIERKTT